MSSGSTTPLKSVQVWSNSFHCWLPGTVVHEGPHGKLTVEYDLPGFKARKHVHLGSRDVLLPQQARKHVHLGSGDVLLPQQARKHVHLGSGDVLLPQQATCPADHGGDFEAIERLQANGQRSR
eukprot:TRINITY_DN1822_c1_g1_i3.p1 TRINITY_DN1822_c1_g1~~TRINITY_DN1822_c1_g1_i3.p1  ORF type:complete len:123 (+),score=26.90 TRINITY_DN1822_c1_g1_i3:71-439(+)